MVNTYRIRLQLKSNFITPWQADTIFGHLCWLILFNDGIEELRKFLRLYTDHTPCFILSNGLPGDYFPRPFGTRLRTGTGGLSKREKIEYNQKAKKFRKSGYVTWDELQNLLCGKIVDDSISVTHANPFKPAYNLHTTIDRNIMTTGIVGELYELEEYCFNHKDYQYLSIYVQIYDETWNDKLKTLFEELSVVGYGKRKSIGKGSFELIDMLPYRGFANSNNECFQGESIKNGALLLSNFIPALTDPNNGYYQTMVKNGKVGETADRPFKRPLLMLKEGSILFDEHPKNFYGTAVKNVAVGRPEVVQYGYGFAVPIQIRE